MIPFILLKLQYDRKQMQILTQGQFLIFPAAKKLIYLNTWILQANLAYFM